VEKNTMRTNALTTAIAAALVSLLAIASPARAQQSYATTDETHTAGAAATGLLTATKLNVTNCSGLVETAQIRYTLDGTTPTSSVGSVGNVGDTIILGNVHDIAGYSDIRTGGTSGVVNFSCSANAPQVASSVVRAIYSTLASATPTLTSETLTATTNQIVLGTTNTTTLNYAAPAASITLAEPTIAGSMPTGSECGASLAAAGTCADTAMAGTFHFAFGTFLLSSNASTVTFATGKGFTSTTTYNCVANDITTRANPVQAIPASATTVTITNTTGATDLISMICVGY
jgi:hypothetical protein